MSLIQIPALIDPHVHFRTPGLEHKENWSTAALSALRGGIVTVFDMPNTLPVTNTRENVLHKKALIDQQLKGLPLTYGLFLGADKHHFQAIKECREHVIGLKIFMGSSTGGLVMEDPQDLETAFRLAAENDLLVAVHAENESLIQKRQKLFAGTDPLLHSQVRNEEVAATAVKEAIALARKYGTRLYLLHVSTEEELQEIAKGKEEGLSIFAETTPHHLFCSLEAYEMLGTKALVNPPLRDKRHHAHLFKAIHSGLIDTIGSDHAPHLEEEKSAPYGKAPSGFPGVETTLPLLLNAVNKGLLKIEEIIRLMHTNPQHIFRFKAQEATLTIDMNLTKTVLPENLASRAKWSPYTGQKLTGWPISLTIKGCNYDLIPK